MAGPCVKGRVESIDALRGVFALLVLTYHTSHWLHLPYPEWLLSLLRMWGIYAVEGFFVISGMALYLATRPGQFGTATGFKNFFAHRYARILPLYALLFLVKPKDDGLEWMHLAELTMVFGFFGPERSSLVGGWSLGVEFVFYLLFPLMALSMRDSPRRAGALLLLAMLAMFGHALAFNLSPPFQPQNRLYVTPINHIGFFVAGYFMGVLYRQGRMNRPPSWNDGHLFLAAMAVFALMALVGANEHNIQVMGGYRRFLLTLLLIILVGAIAMMRLKGRVTSFLGDISYALYLIHPFVVFGLLPRLDIANVWINLAIVYGLSIPLSFLSHRYFEMPAQRFIRRAARA
jgi:peptidoglycan/LPS O-acetylase OafA/YrhL